MSLIRYSTDGAQEGFDDLGALGRRGYCPEDRAPLSYIGAMYIASVFRVHHGHCVESTRERAILELCICLPLGFQQRPNIILVYRLVRPGVPVGLCGDARPGGRTRKPHFSLKAQRAGVHYLIRRDGVQFYYTRELAHENRRRHGLI